MKRLQRTQWEHFQKILPLLWLKKINISIVLFFLTGLSLSNDALWLQ